MSITTTPDVSIVTAPELSSVCGLDGLGAEELDQFQSEVGSVVLESALVQYMITLTPAEQTTVAEWIESHGLDVDFFEQFCTLHQDFEQIFLTELQNFTTEAKTLFA